MLWFLPHAGNKEFFRCYEVNWRKWKGYHKECWEKHEGLLHTRPYSMQGVLLPSLHMPSPIPPTDEGGMGWSFRRGDSLHVKQQHAWKFWLPTHEMMCSTYIKKKEPIDFQLIEVQVKCYSFTMAARTILRCSKWTFWAHKSQHKFLTKLLLLFHLDQ